MKISVCGISSSEVIGHGGLKAPKTSQTTAITLGCPLKLDGKITMLKTQCIFVEEHRGNQTRTNLDIISVG